MAEITADILTPRSGPAISTTSDMPTFDAPPLDTVLAPAAPPVAAATPDVNALSATDAAAPTADTPPSPVPDEPPAEPTPDADVEPPSEDPTPAAEPPAVEPTQRHGRPTLQERINDLTAARKAAEALVESEKARAERAERLVEEMLGRVPKPQDTAPPTPDPPPPTPVLEPEPTTPRPQRENFDAPDAYDEALLAWATERSAWRIKRDIQVSQAEQEQHQRAQREAAERETQQQTQAQREQEIENAYQTRVTTVIEKHPDFNAVVSAPDLPIPPWIADAIKRSEDGPEVAYYLGKNPDVAKKIAAIAVPGQFFPPGHQYAGQPIADVQGQLIELGKVFATVATPATPPVAEAVAPPPAPIPPPPAPITPLRRGNQAAVAKTLEEIGNDPDGMEEYARLREETRRSSRAN